MELVEYQCPQRWSGQYYVNIAVVCLSSFVLLFIAAKQRLHIRRLESRIDWENTVITSKLHNVFADVRELRENLDRRSHILGQILHTLDGHDMRILSIQSSAKKKPLTVTEMELKKMRWTVQMLVFSLHYGMPLHLDKVCLEDFMNKEGHSVRTYAEKYIYPEVITTPNDMYNFALEHLYGGPRAWEKDKEIARTWLEKAAEKNHIGAIRQLRLMN